MTSPQLIPQNRGSAAELAPLAETEISDVARFIAAQSGRGKADLESHLRWFLLENPARTREQPLGFALRASGELVGCILCSPQAFQNRNEKFVLMGSSSFYVDERYRGHGGRIFLQYSRLANCWPLFGTSANPEAAALWKAAAAHPIPHADGELLGILNWPPVAEEFAHRRMFNRFVSRLAGSSGSKLATLLHPLKIDRRGVAALQPLTSAEQVSDLISGSRCEKVTALRDRAYLQWRYFSGQDSSVAIFGFRSEPSRQNILVTLNQRMRGYRRQIRTVNVLDVYPEISAEEWLKLLGVLIARYSSSVDAIVLRNQSLENRKRFCEQGFHWRAFDAANGWFLDRTKHLPGADLYIVPADGDGLI
jgi:hypothetical protein